MEKRRDFIKKASLLSIGLPLMGAMGCKGDTKGAAAVKSTVDEAVKSGFTLDEFGLQLWSIKDAMYKDPKGTLKKLGEYGYDTVESFQGDQGVFWDMTAKDFKTFLGDCNLNMLSAHCDSGYALDPKKRDEFKKLVDDASEIGMKYLTNPYLGSLKTKDEFKKATDGFSELGEICRANGLMYCYHNHHYSFQELDGEFPQDIMMKGTEGANVGFEMDIYWVVAAGQDPEKWLKKYPNRFVMSHVKDRYKADKVAEIKKEEGADENFGVSASCVLGTGQIDFNQVLQTAKDNGMSRYIVEQERFDGMTSMEAIEKDAAFMKQYRV